MLTQQNTLDIPTYATLDDFLFEKNMLHSEFNHEIDLGFIHEISLSSYNGAIDLSTPWQLTQGNVNEALYQEAIHTGFYDTDLDHIPLGFQGYSFQEMFDWIVQGIKDGCNTLFALEDTHQIFVSFELY